MTKVSSIKTYAKQRDAIPRFRLEILFQPESHPTTHARSSQQG